jgi:hypothetical protein
MTFTYWPVMLNMAPKSPKEYSYVKHTTLHVKLITVIITNTVCSMKCENQCQILCHWTDAFFNKQTE